MLDLSSHGYNARNIESLVDVLKQNPDVENLILYRNSIDGCALETLIPALMGLPRLKKLNLGYNCIRDNNIEKLTSIVEKGLLVHLVLTMNTGLTSQSLDLINCWRKMGIVVDTYHIKISPQLIKNDVEEERSCEFSM